MNLCVELWKEGIYIHQFRFSFRYTVTGLHLPPGPSKVLLQVVLQVDYNLSNKSLVSHLMVSSTNLYSGLHERRREYIAVKISYDFHFQCIRHIYFEPLLRM